MPESKSGGSNGYGLQGTRAVVTGSTRGIGRGIAVALGMAGASVVLNGLEDDAAARETTDRLRAAGVTAVAVHGDVTDEGFVGELLDTAATELGGVDILVNNVGGGVNVPFAELSVEEWDRTVRRNLRAAFICTRHVLGPMVEQGFGRVINISSQLAVKGGFQLAHYAAAKAGMIGLTKSLALEYARTGVTFNVIAPGRISTEERPGGARVSQEWLDRKLAEIPLGRFGRVEEVAATALLVASSPGGDFYQGQTFHPNGGEVMP